MKKYYAWAFAAALTTGSLFTACDENSELLPDDPQQGEALSRYVVAAQSGGSSSTAMYLATSETLDEGTLSTVGNGLETESGSNLIFYKDAYLFNFQYNDGGQGTAFAYALNAQTGKAEEVRRYTFNRTTTYGTWGDNVITASTNVGSEEHVTNEAGEALYAKYLQTSWATVKASPSRASWRPTASSIRLWCRWA